MNKHLSLAHPFFAGRFKSGLAEGDRIMYGKEGDRQGRLAAFFFCRGA